MSWDEVGDDEYREYQEARAEQAELEHARRRSPRERWGTCCPHDPHCKHSFLDVDELTRWMDTPITDAVAAELA